MSNLNQTQKEYLKTFTNVEARKAFKKAYKETLGLTDDQLYCIDNTVYTDSARKKLIKLFREENLLNNLNRSIN
jgi:hypothetical protein